MRCATGRFVAAAGALLAALNAQAGGWVSSGGESFRDGLNPWFVQNTRTVVYCVVRDEKGFSASEARARALVRTALEFWKRDFRELKNRFLGGSAPLPIHAVVGTQDFVEVPCDGSEDLRFHLGWGTLSSEQRLFFQDPRRFVGAAVRTSYDEEWLRGRGFIFVGSDRGPESFVAAESMVEEPWSRDGLLYRVIAHELGHVFGLSHQEEGLMLAAYPELILRKDGTVALSRLDTLESPLLPRPAPEACGVRGAECAVERTFRHGIQVMLNPSQSVFPRGIFVTSPSAVIEEWSGSSRGLDGVLSPFAIRSGPGFLEIRTVREGRFEPPLRRSWACRADSCGS